LRFLTRLVPVSCLVVVAALLGGCQGGCGVKPQPQPGPAPIPVPPQPLPPGPQPDPGPQPAAVAGFVVVEDTAAANQARGMFLGSKKVSAFLKNSGLKHAIVSTGSQSPNGAPIGGPLGVLISDAKAKELPRLYLVDAAGKSLKDQKCPLDPDDFVKVFAPKEHARAMGMIPAMPKLKWTVYGTTPETPMIPRSEWKEVDLEAYLPPVHDQDGRGQCNASATCTCIEGSREIAGQSYDYLSAGDLYSQINGGRDQGSTLEDGLAAALHNGVATVKLVPYVWDGRNHGRDSAVTAERMKYRVTEAYLCPTFDHLASALQQGFLVVHGLMWRDNFKPDSDGWLPTQGRGGAGGHALCGYGLAARNGSWGIKTRNSWGVTWGMGGNCVIPESLFGNQITGYWAIRSVTRTADPFDASGVRRAKLSLSPDLDFSLAP
jgi:hypothetical protein